MPETRSMARHGNVVAEWGYLEARASGSRPDLTGEDEEIALPDEPTPAEERVPGSRRSAKTAEKIRRVIAEATGMEPEEVEVDTTDMVAVADLINYDLVDPQAAFAALDAALQEPQYDEERHEKAGRILNDAKDSIGRAKAGQSDRRYVLRDIEWRDKYNLPRKKKRGTSPSEQPDQRRLQYIKSKAKKLGISVEEAAALTRVHKRHEDAER